MCLTTSLIVSIEISTRCHHHQAGEGVYRVTEVVSDTELHTREPLSESLSSIDYKIFPQMDQVCGWL